MGERPDWKWYQSAGEEATAGNLEAAEQIVANALDAGHLWRVSLLAAPALQSLQGRPRFEAVAAEARRRADARQLRPQVLVAMPERVTLAPLLLVLHGATGNAATELARWRSATEQGFIVAAAQSSQPATADGFCWDPPRERVWQDLRVIATQLPTHARLVLAGFSQGAWIALNLALEGSIVVAGSVVMIAPFAGPDPNLPPAWRRMKVSILIGEKDTYRDPVEKLVEQLRQRDHHVLYEVVAALGHEYPPDFPDRIAALLRPPRVPSQARAPEQSG